MGPFVPYKCDNGSTADDPEDCPVLCYDGKWKPRGECSKYDAFKSEETPKNEINEKLREDEEEIKDNENKAEETNGFDEFDAEKISNQVEKSKECQKKKLRRLLITPIKTRSPEKQL